MVVGILLLYYCLICLSWHCACAMSVLNKRITYLLTYLLNTLKQIFEIKYLQSNTRYSV